MTVSDLPALNALFNLSSTLFLISGFFFIRRKNISAHRFCMITAFLLSIAFLASYLIYHYHIGSMPYKGTGWLRSAYYFILITHIFLAGFVPFLAFVTLYRAFCENWTKHRHLAVWTFPVWLYVSITGVVIYVMLYL